MFICFLNNFAVETPISAAFLFGMPQGEVWLPRISSALFLFGCAEWSSLERA
jgi:hypothetical protein